jgi:hypothetical protein
MPISGRIMQIEGVPVHTTEITGKISVLKLSTLAVGPTRYLVRIVIEFLTAGVR